MKLAAVLVCGVVLALGMFASQARAQSGSIEFVARATPSGGIEEPVRGFPFFLLSKSFEQIGKEVNAVHPQPDMNAFIDGLDVSKEMKAWMKKNHWVQISGEDFLRKVMPPDIIDVPEFYSAYIARNAGSEAMGFPKPKYKSSDKAKDPAKYDKMVQEYHEAIRRYIEANPSTKDGMDLELTDKDPDAKWQVLVAKRNPEIQRESLELAQSKYLVARTQTNLQGEGYLRGIAPGNYWLTTLDVTAEVGDVRARWDVPVSVQPGQAAYVALSNVNAVPPATHDSP